MKKSFLTVLFLLLLNSVVFASPIVLTNWTQEGPVANGSWTKQDSDTAVYQSINGNPTYFVSDTNYANTEFNGKFQVQTPSDDDFIGFVFGFNGLDDYYLFDWKQNNQDSALEGFTLSRISGGTPENSTFWSHSGANLAVMASSYGTTLGWADNTEYDFTLLYQDNRIKIDIDGTNIFDITSGTYATGKFGFYNYSQSNVRYQGFEEEVVPPNPGAVPEPTTILLFGLGLLGFSGVSRKK